MLESDSESEDDEVSLQLKSFHDSNEQDINATTPIELVAVLVPAIHEAFVTEDASASTTVVAPISEEEVVSASTTVVAPISEEEVVSLSTAVVTPMPEQEAVALAVEATVPAQSVPAILADINFLTCVSGAHYEGIKPCRRMDLENLDTDNNPDNHWLEFCHVKTYSDKSRTITWVLSGKVERFSFAEFQKLRDSK